MNIHEQVAAKAQSIRMGVLANIQKGFADEPETDIEDTVQKGDNDQMNEEGTEQEQEQVVEKAIETAQDAFDVLSKAGEEDLFEKATYVNNSKNRKLGRVGQQYGGKKFKQGDKVDVVINGQTVLGEYGFFSGNLHNVNVNGKWYSVKTADLNTHTTYDKEEAKREKERERTIYKMQNLKTKIHSLQKELEAVEREQENDPDILADPYNGSNPAVIAYGDRMEKIHKQMDKYRTELYKLSSAVQKKDGVKKGEEDTLASAIDDLSKAGTEDLFEKAKHNHGDWNPKHTLQWNSELRGGQGDWQTPGAFAKHGQKKAGSAGKGGQATKQTEQGSPLFFKNGAFKKNMKRYNEDGDVWYEGTVSGYRAQIRREEEGDNNTWVARILNKYLTEYVTDDKGNPKMFSNSADAYAALEEHIAKKPKLSSIQQKQVDAVLDAMSVVKSEYADASKLTLEISGKGNWIVKYDGKYTGTILNANLISSATAEKMGWYDPKKTASGSSSQAGDDDKDKQFTELIKKLLKDKKDEKKRFLDKAYAIADKAKEAQKKLLKLDFGSPEYIKQINELHQTVSDYKSAIKDVERCNQEIKFYEDKLS